MKLSPRLLLRSLAVTIGIVSIGFSWSCLDRPMKVADPSPNVTSDFPAAEGQTRNVDLLFVIDNSGSMEEEQIKMTGNFPQLMMVLKDISGGLPNIHIGVTSTDLGTSPYNIGGCETPNGDNGKLLKGETGSCANPINQNYIVDIEPKGCNIVKDENDQCTSTDCDQSNCDTTAFTDEQGNATEPAGLQIYTDSKGCPRCRNYNGESLETVFSCIATLGIHGCGFEQHLESMYRVFSENNPENQGFFRENAYLAIFFITDEDDCSAQAPTLFSDPQADINSTLGVLESFRCTEFGIKCDEDWQRVMQSGSATYHNCKARTDDDAKNMLWSLSKYVNYLYQIKSSDMIIVGAIAGPYNDVLTVGLDKHQNPALQTSCGTPEDGAVPTVRIKEFVESFVSDPQDMNWAYTSVCNVDYTPALTGLGEKIKKLVEVHCITTPLAGCPDPAAANGYEPITSLPTGDASTCTPNCNVMDVYDDGTRMEIPLCDSDYAGGHPPKRDQQLPVPACYHITYNPKCDIGSDHAPSRGAEIIISRQVDPPPKTNALITCQGMPLVEKLCYDGLDNDHDGLIDNADSDCSN